MRSDKICVALVLGCAAACSAHSAQEQQNTTNSVAVPATALCMARQVNIEQAPPAQTEQMAVTLSGRVEDACASAWLVVHPGGSDRFQVQSPLAVGKDGRWLTSVRLGEAEQGEGKTFEMVVFANAAAKLKEGDVLAAWPAAESRSAVMTVARNAPAPEVAAEPVAEPTTPARPPADPPDCRLEIVNSLHEGRVTDHTEVRVEASAGCRVASVWVVVHPTAVETYWVQGRASARANVWRTNAYFGRPGRDWGARFEIKAFADPTRPLRVGQELPYWPEAAVSSNLIEVSKVQRNPAATKKASSSGSFPTSVGYTGAVPNPRCIGCPYKH